MMEKPKHTPGPWQVEAAEDELIRLPLEKLRSVGYGNLCKIVEPLLIWTDNGDGTYHTIAQVDSDELANARLIAAAPDLLEALKEVVNYLGAYHPARPRIEAIIAKVEGGK